MPKSKTPDQKAVIYSPQMSLYRNLVPYAVPQYMDGNMWRRIARTQSIIGDIIATLTMHVENLPWDIRATKPEETDQLREDIDYHKDVLKNANNGAGFLNYLESLIQDLNELPFGMATETVRITGDKSKDDRGKLYKIVSVDGATFAPIYDPTGFLVAIQQPPNTDGGKNQIVFNKNELVRNYRFPRTEISQRGWGMPPHERAYLAVELLSRGDKYYANLLLDTPEAGILDLGDMSKESAEKWIDSFRLMFSGLDPFKVPVIFEHNTPVKWLPFGRPPSEISYNETTLKYAEILTAAYGLMISDIGLRGGGGSLTNTIRDERKSRSTGYAAVRNLIQEHINNFLPKYLTFTFVDIDDEVLVARGRARSANAIAGRNLVEAGIVTPELWLKQMVADGLFTIPIAPNQKVNIDDFEVMLQLKGKQPGQETTNTNGDIPKSVAGGKRRETVGREPVPASQGGMGEIKRAAFDDTHDFRELIYDSFQQVLSNATQPRLRRLVKMALKSAFPVIRMAIDEGADFNHWTTELQQYYFDDIQNKDEIIQRSVNGLLSNLNPYFTKDKWWHLSVNKDELESRILRFYLQGLADGAKQIQESLYENDIVEFPEVSVEVNADKVKNNPLFRARMAVLIDMLNNGTEQYLKRLSSAVILDANKIPALTDKIQDGNIDSILADDSLINYFADKLRINLANVFMERADIITDVESRIVYNLGVYTQAKAVGIQSKTVIHVGSDAPCAECQEAVAVGRTDINHEYNTKFGRASEYPPFHPDCHCQMKYEVSNLTEQPNYYNGE
jgi:hypothetical protein